MSHIKIVKTASRPETQFNGTLDSYQAQMQLVQTQLATLQTSMENLKALQQNLQASLDAMNEMSQITVMTLQMAMDRRSKFVEAVSNIMKKIDDTQAAIVQNMK